MHQVLLILAGFLIFAEMFARLRLGVPFGLLVAGAALGPFGFGLIADVEVVAQFAELGVIFLLFNVGLELKLDRMRVFGWRVYTVATAQMAFTTAVFAYIVQQLGVAGSTSILLGAILALSSTVIALQILNDLGRTLTQVGRLAVAILLFQDLAVGPLLVAIDMVGAGNEFGLAMIWLFLRAILAIGLIIFVVKFAIPYAFRLTGGVRAPELFIVIILLVVLGSSWVTDYIGLSAAIGAFVAGLMIAGSEFRHQVAAEIAPIRGLFVGLFFMAVGMQINISLAMASIGTIVIVALLMVTVKFAILTIIARALGYTTRQAMEVGILLSEGSEFAFVALVAASAAGIFPVSTTIILTVAIALSMAAISISASLSRSYLNRTEGQAKSISAQLHEDTSEIRNHVLIVGFGQVGKALTRHMLTLGVPVLVLDYDSKNVGQAWSRGLPVYYGNATRTEVLRAAQINHAQLIVIATSSSDVTARVISVARNLQKNIPIIARAEDEDESTMLFRAGANTIVLDGLSTAMELAERTIPMLDRPLQPPEL